MPWILNFCTEIDPRDGHLLMQLSLKKKNKKLLKFSWNFYEQNKHLDQIFPSC